VDSDEAPDEPDVATLPGSDDPTEDETGVAEQFDLDFSVFDEKSFSGEGTASSEDEDPDRAAEGEGVPDESEVDAETGVDDDSPDGLTDEHYVRATTRDYEDLARSIEEAEAEDHPQQAFSVSIPGLDPGVVGFEDVTGEQETVPVETDRPSDLPLRIGTALGLLAVLLSALFAPQRGWLAALVGLFALVAVVELYATVRSAGFNPMVLIGVLGSTTVLAGAWFGGDNGPYAAGAFAVGTLGVLMLWYVLTGMHRPLENGSMTALGVLWIALLMAYAMPIIRADDYRVFILFAVIVNAALDIGSYFVGRGLGRTRLAPVLSPNKTVEGLVGGALLAVGVGVGLAALSYFAVFEIGDALVLSLVIVVFSVLGDLTESLVKRSLGVKDMGSILPGHGGILDRIDGLIFVLPAVYYALSWLDLL
jgi:phosphatidate cytidylyltransferase